MKIKTNKAEHAYLFSGNRKIIDLIQTLANGNYANPNYNCDLNLTTKSLWWDSAVLQDFTLGLWLSVSHEKCRKSPGLLHPFLPSDFGVSVDRGVTKRREVKPTVSAAEKHLCNLAELQEFSFRETCLLVVTVNQTWGVTVWPAVGNKGWKCHWSFPSLHFTSSALT